MSSSLLPSPTRIVSSNVLPVTSGHNEPIVETVKGDLEPHVSFEGNIRRYFVGTDSFPANNDAPLRAEIGPGSGITMPGGTNVYYLELAPGYTSPMHRTVSADFMVVQSGTPTLVTPKGPFDVVDGKANYTETVETVCNEGEVVVQRGQFHAWKNDTDQWVRFLGVVVHATAQEIEVGETKEKKKLVETWL